MSSPLNTEDSVLVCVRFLLSLPVVFLNIRFGQVK
jgi:hypothetical protein